MNTLGRHLLAELYGCDIALLDDLEAVSEHLRAAAAAVGVTVVGSAFHRYAPQGVSGVLLIAESHLSLHTWPEARYVAVDIFTCGGLDPRPAIRHLARAFAAEDVRMHEVVRGVPDDVAHGLPLLPGDVSIISRSLDEPQ
jgi:S-adenosylmethionine decarboxylase proenzyme